MSTVRFLRFSLSTVVRTHTELRFSSPWSNTFRTTSSRIFYRYCNGDLLFHSDLISALHSLASKIETGALKSRVFIVGRRLNYDHQNIGSRFPRESTLRTHSLRNTPNKATFSKPMPKTTFSSQRNALPWRFIVDVVVGRPATTIIWSITCIIEPTKSI